ncbi:MULTISPECIES: hydroxyethylthiazole kinase [unclassified Enterococcus]|uniref:hydroxyethylthiazole kinase n=1 Tax=unclassified Enterococcus TaxID=2608891 RepID=UPI001553EF74|nr:MULTISPECIES: hydroxyethylthiazole kinase [unclassified Enterococcus]MBS7576572.1 hydroxyethylthiazole kinase [Enterococcus sp. MMGLQ5-2]MBS7583941.1 hydroxyethylthiazole kinase [Enterococcus sp. MMGLQ5-1]NPD11802.1 hydroxyethylthiazole kinase [Enterococcus sp. MMGLQ5-1]NPD36409.1 hydroxyethylthiazole kinase [Enterococcus sp. MMGLQ5-2]
MYDAVQKAITAVCVENPMVHSITNSVTVDFVANAQLAVGAAAAMTEFTGDSALLTQFSRATYINMGTLSDERLISIPEAIQAGASADVPLCVDPVAVGLGMKSDELIIQLKNSKPALFRGNASEIIAVAKLWGLSDENSQGPKGVESADAVDSAKSAAIAIAKYTGGAVAVSGAIDLVTDGIKIFRINGGNALATKVTGFGCSLAGVCAAYLTVTSPLVAALTGTLIYNLAQNEARLVAKGPASFKVAFIDSLYQLTHKSNLFNSLDYTEYVDESEAKHA